MYTVPIMTESKNTLSAVIKTGGKQYHVAVGNTIVVEKLDGELAAGGNFTFSDVLLIDNGTDTKVGTPTLSGATVVAEFIESGRHPKIDVIRYRAKTRYFKKNGHRQPFMKFKITGING